MRNFQSAPNGDFVSWFPDWFGVFGITPVWEIRDIEIKSLSIDITDDTLVTHVAVAGDTDNLGTGVNYLDFLISAGVVSLEEENILQILSQVDPHFNREGLSPAEVIQKYGMRPEVESIPSIRTHEFEALWAVFTLLKHWTAQYITPVEFTFMPELLPGMRISLPSSPLHPIPMEFYVEEVIHSGSRTAGFKTRCNLSCPRFL